MPKITKYSLTNQHIYEEYSDGTMKRVMIIREKERAIKEVEYLNRLLAEKQKRKRKKK